MQIPDSIVDSGDREARALQFDSFVQQSEWMPFLLSESGRAQFVNSLTPVSFVNLLRQVNGVLTSPDGSSATFHDKVSYVKERSIEGREELQVNPAPEDREELLAYVLAAAQEAESAETKAMILGFGINAVHPFLDGNGRTARATYALVAHDYMPASPVLNRAVAERGNKDMVLAPSVFGKALTGFLQESMHSTVMIEGKATPRFSVRAHDPKFDEKEGFSTPRRSLDLEEVETMANILGNVGIGPTIAHIMDITMTQRSVRSAIKDFGYRRKVLYADDFLTNASTEEVARVYDIFREVTVARTKLLIDVLAGRSHEDVIVVGRSKMNEGYSFQEFGRRAANGAMLAGVEV